MALPEKESFDFDELAARWNVAPRDVVYYATHSMLQALVWIDSFAIETDEKCPISEALKMMGPQGIKGYVIVSPDDVHRISLDGLVRMRCFRTSDKNMICFIPCQMEPITIKGEHLRVHINERTRFEDEHDLKAIDKIPQPLVSYPGRTSVMHKIMAKFEERCGLGEIAPKLIEECRQLRQWFVKSNPNDQPPSENSIANALRQAYRKATAMQFIDQHTSGHKGKLPLIPLWLVGTKMGFLSDLFDFACDCVV